MNFSISLYKKTDEENFQRYIRAAFHANYILSDPRYLEWQYGSNLLLAKHGDEIIGHFGFNDIPYKMYDSVMPVRVLMNLFVKEEYRLTGVAALLAQRIFDTKNPVLVSGYTPTAQKLFSHLRIGWNNAGVLTRWIAVLDKNVPLLQGYTIPRMAVLETSAGDIVMSREVPSELFINQCWDRVNNRFPVTVERNFNYIKRRFITHPFFSYVYICTQQNGIPAGFIIARIEEDQGLRIARIIDMVAMSSAELPLIGEFLAMAKEETASVVDFLLSGHFYDKALASAGFFPTVGTDFERFHILFSPLSFKKVSVNIGYDIAAPFDDCFITKADGD